MALLIYFSYLQIPVVEEAEGIEVASLVLPLEAAAAAADELEAEVDLAEAEEEFPGSCSAGALPPTTF